tara:strand:+ start:2866 stop:3276 length:411 start_codon:yes stop_codon:yes gene_type:complete
MIKHNHLKKIFYKDVDQMGIVYYSRYLEFFEEARTELLSKIGLNISLVEGTGIYLPVITSHCDYKRSAKLEQVLNIKTSINKIPNVKLKIEYEVSLYEDSTLIASGYTIHAFTNSLGKPQRIPTEIQARIVESFNN